MNPALFAVGLLTAVSLCAQTAITERLTPREDFSISPIMVPKKFMGKDFRFTGSINPYDPPADPKEKAEYDANLRNDTVYRPVDKQPPEMRKYMENPAFDDQIVYSGYVDNSVVVKNPDGTLTFDPDKMEPWCRPEPQVFVPSVKRFTRPYKKGYKHYFYQETFRHPDRTKYLEWKKKHPNLLAVHSMGEWGNESNILYHRIEKYIKEAKLTPAQQQELFAKWPNTFKDRRDYIENRLKKVFDRHASTWFNDPSILAALEGMWCINHLAGYWGGCRLLLHETSRGYALWQLQMMFNRGAARQFGSYWGWYVASYYNAFNPTGKFVTTERIAWRISDADLPEGGISLNSIERIYRAAWLAGANTVQREDAGRNFWNRKATGPDRWKPVAEGQAYIKFADFFQHTDRGTPLIPVALLVPYDQGACRQIGKAFNRFPYLRKDNMFHGFVAEIFEPIPKRRFQKKGIEVTLRSSPYGDIFDILTPDFPDNSALRKTLPGYKAAVLIGDYEKHPAMAEALREYVEKGGTLILNSVQLNNFGPDFTGVKLSGETVKHDGYVLDKFDLAGAKPISKLPDGTVVLAAFDFGKGRVITASPRYLVPDFPEGGKEADDVLFQTKVGTLRFPYIRMILTQLAEETLPVKVEGSPVLYGVNKTEDGWLFYAFNNRGVHKWADAFETFDQSKTAKVNVTLKGISANKLKDLVSGKEESLTGKAFTLTIPPGSWSILSLKE